MFAPSPKLTYIEDVFVQVVDTIDFHTLINQPQDLAAMNSFCDVISRGSALTANQANFVLKLLNKYKASSIAAGFDYSSHLENPVWKHPFRVINLSKRIWVEKEEREIPYVCMMFPYQLKTSFESEFKEMGHSTWDAERKIRRAPLYSCNLIQLNEFATKNGFDIDDTFLIALGEVEEIWQNQDDILPRASIIANFVALENSSPETDEWFKANSTWWYEGDLFLAKSMGYLYSGAPYDTLTKICASPSNHFWIKNNVDLFNVYNKTSGKMCVVLDRTANTLDWLKQFTTEALASGVNRADIRVCFRAAKGGDTAINDWIRDNGFGGKVGFAKIYIFEHKPAKWLFKDVDSVKLLVTNNIYPPTNVLTRDWMNTHPCVVYLGDIKPSEARKNKIVEL